MAYVDFLYTMMIKNKLISFQILGFLAAVSYTATNTHAKQIYMYKKENGSALFTNKRSSDKSLQQVKITYYSDSNIHSYKNWGNSEASVLPSYSRNKNAFDHIIQEAASKHGVSEGLIKAVMHTESGFNVNARSPVGAQGLMQLMPATARRFNVSNAYDPHQNIMAGAKYLSWLLNRFNGNTSLALAGYNAGEGNVTKYGGIPPFRETQDYVRRVTSRYHNLYASSLGNSNASSTIVKDSTPVSEPAISTANSSSEKTNTKLNTTTKPLREIIRRSDGTFAYANAPHN